jgi:hypothetical protein
LSLGSLSPQALPRDAVFVELRPDVLIFQTRECLLPGTEVRLRLVMEGQRLPMVTSVTACLVVDRDKAGYLFHIVASLTGLRGADRQLVSLFIGKGRGEPQLEPAG